MDTSSKKLIVKAAPPNQDLENAFRNLIPIQFGGKRWFVVAVDRSHVPYCYYGIECPDELLGDWA